MISVEFNVLKAQHSAWDIELTLSEGISKSGDYELFSYCFSGIGQDKIDEVRGKMEFYSGASIELDKNFFKSKFSNIWLIEDKMLSEVIVRPEERGVRSVKVEFVYTEIQENVLSCEPKGEWVQKGKELHGDAERDQFGTSVSLSSNGEVLAIGSYAYANGDGYVKVYQWLKGKWTPRGDVIRGGSDLNGFGSELRLSGDGNTVIVGAPFSSKETGESEGCILIFEWKKGFLAEKGKWMQKGETIYGENTWDFLGASLAINDEGSTIVAGSGRRSQNENTGYVKVFQWDEVYSEWKQKSSTIYDRSLSGLYGFSVDLDGEGRTTAVGVPSYGRENEGYVKIWHHPYFKDGYQQVGKRINGIHKNDKVGDILRISSNGDVIAVSSKSELNDYQTRLYEVRVYRNKNKEWEAMGSFIKNENSSIGLITSVEMNHIGHTIIIGSSSSDSADQNAGQARVFEWNGKNWCKKGEDIFGESKDDSLGKSVSISADGNIIVVSATGSDKKGHDSGQVKVYEWKK